MQITVTATKNDDDASLSYESPTDADATTEGHQVTLSVGTTEVEIRVTAADGDVRDYTIEVTRTGPDTSLTPAASDPAAPFISEAVYRVTFQGTWTTAATPDGVPSGAHFSRLVGAVHSDGVAFLTSGSTASAGIEAMAEEDATATLKTEVQTAITATTALGVLEGSSNRINPTSSATPQATLSTAHPRITLVTMVRPQPRLVRGRLRSALDQQRRALAPLPRG